MQEYLKEHGLQHVPARQAFALRRGAHQTPAHITLPDPCHDEPPSQPNIYTDGSLTHPRQPEYSLGGAGAWHPKRALATQPPSETEAQLAVFEQLPTGLQLCINLPGQTTSSTRAEIAAAILAIAAPGPVHFGTDSQALCAKLAYIHHLLRHGMQPKRPLALCKDGDLWTLYNKCAHSKGVASIAVSKVKAHATSAMVTAGEVRLDDKEGNDAADEAADEGVALFEQSLISLSDHFATRQVDYIRMLQHLVHHITFTYRIRAALLQHHSQPPHQSHNTTSTSAPKPKPTMPAKAPAYHTDPPDVHYYPITQLITIQQCPRALARHPASTDIQAFLMSMPILDHRKGRAGRPFTGAMGITWLELYVLFRLAGHAQPIRVATDSANARPALQQQLHRFRTTVKQVVHLTCSPSDQWLIKGKDVVQHRLQGLGVSTYLPVLPWQPHLTPSAQHQIAIEILKSQQGLTQPKAMAALQAQRPVTRRRLLLKGRTRWSQAIRPMPQALYPPSPAPPCHLLPQGRGDMIHPHDTLPTNHCTTTMGGSDKADPSTISFPDHCTTARASHASPAASTVPSDFQAHASRPSSTMADPSDHITNRPNTTTPPAPTSYSGAAPAWVFFQCPKCPHKLSGQRPVFDLHNLDYKVWCRQCKRSWAINRWQCDCGSPWHVCPQHKGEPHRLRSTTPHGTPPGPRATTTAPSLSLSPAVQSTAAPRTTTKRVLGQGKDRAIHSWLDLPAPKRSRPPPAEVELGPVVTMATGTKHYLLGPKLRAKFPRVGSTTPTSPPPPDEHPVTTASPSQPSTQSPNLLSASQPHSCSR